MESEIGGTVCAIDIGAWTTKISVLQEKGFEILVNEANFRETPSVVGYTSMQRMIGEQGMIKIKTNYKNTIKSPLRLIRSDNSFNSVQEELKYCPVTFHYDDILQFTFNQGDNSLILTSQQILIALMTKIIHIIGNHNINIKYTAICIPTFLTPSDRKIIYQCARIAKMGQIVLVDDWVAIATDYAYFRTKQLDKENQGRYIAFIDAGHSKFAIYVCQITRNFVKLVTSEVLKFTGSRNMDNLVLQYYSDIFYKKTGLNILTNQKALAKIIQNLQKQRKILSANIEHHLNVECLIGEQDFDYCMKRQQFENIIMPILGEMATALNKIKQTISLKNIKLKAIQLIGGSSRIPFFQQIVSDIFGMEISRTLNSSESIVRGANIDAAIRTGSIKFPGFTIQNINNHQIWIFWNQINQGVCFGKNPKLYNKQNSKVLFSKNSVIPNKENIKFNKNALYEIIIIYDIQFSSNANGYCQFEGQSLLYFELDINKLLRCYLEKNDQLKQIQISNISQQTWNVYQQVQQAMNQRDQDIIQIYHRKNQYEALLYQVRDKVTSNIQINAQKKKQILYIVQSGEQWISMHHQVTDLNQYNQRIQILMKIMEDIKFQTEYLSVLEQKLQIFIKAADKAINTIKSQEKVQEISAIKDSVLELYNANKQNNWKDPTITGDDIDAARQQIIKTCLK